MAKKPKAKKNTNFGRMRVHRPENVSPGSFTPEYKFEINNAILGVINLKKE